jgi:hypothetical protein
MYFFSLATRKPMSLLAFMEKSRRGGKFHELGPETDFLEFRVT